MENNKTQSYQNKSRHKSGLIFALLLILIGALLIAINFGAFPYNINRIFISWQMLLIIIGLVKLFKGKILSSLAFLFTGGFFIIPRLAEVFPESFLWVNYNFTSVYWPILLIGAGILLLLYFIIKPKRKWDYQYASNTFNHRKKKSRPNHSSRGIERNSIFGEGEHIILDPEFYGGEMNAVFGGITLDLRKTNLPEGETFLEINAVFGGITIFVPEDWNVEFHLDSVFGGFKDNRITLDDSAIDKSRALIIEGSCIFGGGELKN